MLLTLVYDAASEDLACETVQWIMTYSCVLRPFVVTSTGTVLCSGPAQGFGCHWDKVFSAKSCRV